MAFENIIPFCKRWIEFTREQKDITIEIRTKSAFSSSLNNVVPHENVILGWTLSPDAVIEQYEWDICYIDGARLLPTSSFDPSTSGLDTETPIYLYCYKGQRSMTALKELWNAGYKNLKNLKGGIDLWAEEVDPDMPQY
jgi:rhodanese-related sulfurtransferase